MMTPTEAQADDGGNANANTSSDNANTSSDNANANTSTYTTTNTTSVSPSKSKSPTTGTTPLATPLSGLADGDIRRKLEGKRNTAREKEEKNIFKVKNEPNNVGCWRHVIKGIVRSADIEKEQKAVM
jgi:hypothetical protein